MVSKALIPNLQIPRGCPTNLSVPVQMPVLMLVPPVHHPLNTPKNKVAVTYVHLMTVEQTANWLWTLGTFKGWKEVQTYVANFKKHSITGAMLGRLNHELLKFELGILDSAHRIELLATIRQLFPSFTPRTASVSQSAPSMMSGMLETDTESDLQVKMIPPSPTLILQQSKTPQAVQYEPCMLDYLVKEQDNSVQMDMSPVQNFNIAKSDSGYSTRSSAKSSSGLSSGRSSAFSFDVSESTLLKLPMIRTRKSFFAQPNKTSEDITRNDEHSAKGVEAPSRLYADLLKVEQAQSITTCSSTTSDTSYATGLSILAIPSESAKSLLLTLPLNQVGRTGNIRNNFLKFNFFVRVEPVNKRSCWLIIFESIEEAKRALNLKGQIGYNLEPYQNEEPRKLMRPTPRNPIEYRVLSKVTIRSGKSLHGKIVGELFKNRIVTINKIKGRRARIIRNGSDLKPVTVGWVSSHTDQGIPLLEQISG